jgi:hypothetical protein
MLNTLDIHFQDVFLFFWPAIVVCVAIGYVAAAKDKKLVGALIGLVGGVALAVLLVVFRGNAPPTVRS